MRLIYRLHYAVALARCDVTIAAAAAVVFSSFSSYIYIFWSFLVSKPVTQFHRILTKKFNTHISYTTCMQRDEHNLLFLLDFLIFLVIFFIFCILPTRMNKPKTRMKENGNALYLQSHHRYRRLRRRRCRHRTQTPRWRQSIFHLDFIFVMCECVFAFNEMTCPETFLFGLC